MADRFPGTSPEHFVDMSADRRAWALGIMNIEGEINSAWYEATQGLGPDDDVVITEWEYELWSETKNA